MPTLRVALTALVLIVPAVASAAATDISVLILAGQSNAVGFAANAEELSVELRAPQMNTRLWYEIGSLESVEQPDLRIASGDAFVPLRFQSDPKRATFGTVIHGFGPELTLGRTVARDLDNPVAIVKFALNATSLAQHWRPEDENSLYAQMTKRVSRAMATLAIGGGTPHLEGFFWVQGESDAANAEHAAAYEENLTRLVRAIRREYFAPELPFIVARLSRNLANATTKSFPFVGEVRDAQTAVAETMTGVVLVDTDDLALADDGIHFNVESQQALGVRLATGLPGVGGLLWPSAGVMVATAFVLLVGGLALWTLFRRSAGRKRRRKQAWVSHPARADHRAQTLY